MEVRTKKIRPIILICLLTTFLSCQKIENENKQKIMNLNLEKATLLFRSDWKEGNRGIATQYLMQYLKIGMTKEEVAKILEYPTRDVDEIKKKDDDIEEWIFTLSLSRILSLRFEHGKLINIFGG